MKVCVCIEISAMCNAICYFTACMTGVLCLSVLFRWEKPVF
jgi:hypothetical protein